MHSASSDREAMPVSGANVPFWRQKTLAQMSPTEWEQLCDGCGQCCLVKLIDADTEELHFTKLACKLLDIGSCRCKDYENRQKHVPDCVRLKPSNIGTLAWLPKSCAYRLVDEGRDLYWWHPLVSGDPETVHQAGVSVRSFARTESRIKEENYWKYLISDPSSGAERELDLVEMCR